MDNKILYAIIFKNSGEVLTSKKVYNTLRKAKQGFSYIPDQLKSQLAIAEFTMNKIVESGAELRDQQEINRIKREYKEKISNLKYKISNCKAEISRVNSLTETLNQLQAELKELTNANVA